MAKNPVKDQLKYVIKSIDLFAPWIRNIYLVTNGQYPSYINETRAKGTELILAKNKF